MNVSESLPITQRPFVFLDFETSHLDPEVGEITEMAAVRFAPGLKEETHLLHRRCRMQWPERASKEALAVNGYDEKLWATAYPIRVALVDLACVLDDTCVLVAHGAAFDTSFLRTACRREQLPFPNPRYTVCTLALALPLVWGGHAQKLNLDHLCTRYGISNVGHHRALADVYRTVVLFKKLLGIA